MGKKKATVSKKLKVVLDDALRTGAIFVKEQKNWSRSWQTDERTYFGYELYNISFGEDKEWFQEVVDSPFLTVEVKLYKTRLEFDFTQSRRNVLSNEVETWFRNELEQILVMHKMGGFKSNNNGPKDAKDLKRKSQLGGQSWQHHPKSISFSIKS